MSPRANIRRRPKTPRRLSPRRLLRFTVMAGVLAAVSTAAGWGLMSLNRALAVSRWHVTAPPDIRTAIEARLEKQPMDFWHSFPPLLRRQLLAAIPELADVQVSRSIGGALDIRAVPRRAVANWLDAKGRMQLVDAGGTAYAGTETVPPVLPMLRLPAAQVPEAAALLDHLQSMSHSLFAHLSEVVAIDGAWKLYFDRGESWVIPQTGAIRRVDHLVALIERPRWRKDAWRIDARMDNRWFIRPAHSKEVI